MEAQIFEPGGNGGEGLGETADNSMEARVFELLAGAAFHFRGRDGF